jgi:aspartate aminotransferase/aminotransferase
LAAKNKGEYVNLSIGQPHFETPKALKEAAKSAIENNFNAYLPTKGILELRKKIAEKLQRENNIKASENNVIVTSGTSGAIFLLLSSIVDPGDEIILPDPYFVLYKEVLVFLGAKIIYLDTYSDFHIDSQKLKKIITPKTKAIILNSPNNPTGAVYGEDELRKVVDVAREHNLLVIADEIYEKFDYAGKFFSIGSVYENTVTLNGFSKSHAIPGWRIGYAHGPKEIIEAMNKLQQYTFVSAPSFSQVALLEEDADLSSKFESYKRKSEYVYENLKNTYEMNKPEGAFYAFIKNPKNSNDFVNEVIEKKLLIVPGSAFSKRGDYFRLSFAASNDALKKGVEILKKMNQVN